MFDRLVDFDADLRIVPGLATRWEVAADVTSVRFALRKGLVFHDGTPFDAAAVKFNVERMMDRERTPTNRPLWDVVAGADIIDAETVIVRTKGPFSQILNSFAHGSGSMVSPASVAKHGEKGVLQNDHIYGDLAPYFAEAAARFPGRFIGLAQVDEPFAYRDDQLAKLEREVTTLGMRGLYFTMTAFCGNGYAHFPDEPLFDPLWRLVAKLKLPVFWVHSAKSPAGTYLDEMNRLAPRRSAACPMVARSSRRCSTRSPGAVACPIPMRVP